jgi:stage II sporulation protein M
MSKNTILNNKFNFYNLFIDLYNRNKKILITSALIFIIAVLIGILMGYFEPEITKNFLITLLNALRSSHIEKTTISIFLNNFRAALITYTGGVIAIIPAFELFYNGLVYGSFLGYFTHGGVISNYGVSTPTDFLIYTIPHGIFEIPALIISGTAGFRLTTMMISVINSILRKKPFNESYWKLKDSLILFALSIVLFFIAAIIEANITPALGNHITGLTL